ncbi:MAG TPA: carbohydrate ABC transporter permease [Ktedonobacteraceae bacterium]
MKQAVIKMTKTPAAAGKTSGKQTQRIVSKGIGRVITYIVLCLAAFLFILPFLWMISGAFKVPSQIVSFPPTFIPKPFTLENFAAVWQSIPLLRYFWNSLFIAVVSTIGTVACSSLVAFGFARIRAKGKNIWFILMLSTMMVPYYVTIIPTFSLYEKLGWLNTYLPLTVPSFLGVGGAFYIFLLRQFFLSIPHELDEAATLDGANFFHIFWHIVLPLSKPALVTVALFQFVASWNDFFAPLIYLSNSSMYTLPVAVRFFQGLYSTDLGPLMAIACVTVLPIIIIFLFAQRVFVQGIATTGIKGG